MANKYEHHTREDLVRILQRRDIERKLGLVWERKEIEKDKQLNDDMIVLNLANELCVGQGPWNNLVIEGDNYDALRSLEMTHAERVKVIIIDPPYNTGNKDFLYNDRYISKDDKYRHSVWLEFMYRRLMLAKELLAKDGVIFINIGEDEYAHLSLLMEEVFPGRKVATFVWKRRIGASDEAGYNVSVDHEYVLCYANAGFSFTGSPKDMSKYSNPDNDPRGAWMSADLTKAHTRLQRPNTYYPIQNPENGLWYPCNPNNVWRFSSQTRIKAGTKIRTKPIEQLILDGKILFTVNDRHVIYESKEAILAAIEEGTAPNVLSEDLPDLDFWIGKPIGYGRPRYKRHMSEMKRTYKPISTMIANATQKIPQDHEVQYLASGLTTEGTRLLANILDGKKFDYPKPISLIKGLLEQSTNPDAGDIILDFFAGSGTTGHAVLAINAEDDGNRQFILVSNTEATEKNPERNLCKDVLQVRMARVIEGYTYKKGNKKQQVDGLEGDFAYFQTRRIAIKDVSLDIRHDNVWTALQLIHFKNVDNLNNNSRGILKRVNEDFLLVYVIQINQDTSEIIKALAKRHKNVVIYSWQPGILRDNIIVDNITIEKIPEYLLERFGGLK